MSERYRRPRGWRRVRPVRPRRRVRRRGRRLRAPVSRAQGLLRSYRRATLLAVAVTSLLLLVLAPEEASSAPDAGAAASAQPASEPEELARATGDEARQIFAELRESILQALPKAAIVLGLLLGAGLLVRLIRPLLRSLLGSWQRSSAVTALTGIVIWVAAVGIAMSVIAGDVRALVGSVGLVGLALSWALQTPIESFTGWLLNAFQGYYRVGDRVEVGEVFGDVWRIDFLTTTVWEIGSPFRPGFVHAEQPTGRLITFPNSQILTGSVMNFTRDFPYVWDELAVQVANESDLRYSLKILEEVARELLGGSMVEPARQYEAILRRERLDSEVPGAPQVFAAVEDAWTVLNIRYLVQARQRRSTKSELILRVSETLSRPEHQGRILPVLPRQQLQLIGSDGRPRNASWFVSEERD